MSLRIRFILLYGLGGVFFLSLITLLVFSRMEAAMVMRLQQQFETNAQVKISTLQQSLEQRSTQFRFVAEIPMFRAIRFHELSLNHAALRDDVRQLELYFFNQHKTLPGLKRVRYVNAKGVEVLRVEDGHIARDLADLSGQAEVQKALRLGPGEVSITVVTQDNQIAELVWWLPVHTSSQSAEGVLSFHMNFDNVQERLLALIANQAGATICLLDEQNQVLASSEGHEHCFDHHQENTHWHVEMPLQLSGIAWKVLLFADKEMALSDVYKIRRLVFGLLLPLTALIAFGMIYITSTRQIMPLRSVSAYLKQLAEGNLEAREIHYRGHDEISELVASAQRLRSGMEATIEQANAVAAGDFQREVTLLSERDQMGKALADMTRMLREMTAANAVESRRKSMFAQLSEAMRGAQDLDTLSSHVLSTLAEQLGANIGVFYGCNEAAKESQEPSAHEKCVKVIATYAYERRPDWPDSFALGEGLVGQAAQEKKMLVVQNLPENFIRIQSGLGCAVPRMLVLLPLLHEDNLRGMVELGSCHDFNADDLDYLKQVAPAVAIELYAAASRTRLEQMLEQTRAEGKRYAV